jgi:hypothetical protein
MDTTEAPAAKRLRATPAPCAAAPLFDVASLPASLRSRVRVLKPQAATPPPQSFVLYWMRSALRAHDNPSLCVSAHAAHALGLPLLVLITVESGRPRDTARRHAFLLEGVRDVAAALADRGVAAAVHVHTTDGGCAPWPLTLAHRASLVVTDEPFVQPWLRGAATLARAGFAALLLAVDAACVVPCRTVAPGACNRAGSYERATAAARAAALAVPYRDAPYDAAALPPLPPLPFAPTPLDDIPALLARCAVDQAVRPVAHTRGGSAAGYARWAAWRAAGGLRRYAATRNTVHNAAGVSRMSAYLNLGMVSPWRLARDAIADKSPKFLNEQQVWRELSYAFCFHHPDTHASLAGLPAWAQRALRERPPPPASAFVSLDALSACRSGAPLWDALQRQLCAAGELHNNARMTWAKQLLGWSASGGEALEKLLFLNDHYALDGQAPPSYGGLLWALGLFTGGPSIATRPLAGQAKRLDAAKVDARTAALVRGAS